ncbi:hypothetical protein [Lelliottia wanjuensis]|uniref:Uncharacterized protein n=1 Tax=Lelliottia wanjuensis TaxID=3050585 RepID=A0AAP4D3Z8_9ENTR|nr:MULTISPECIES: hypothetical protein [unclassified Lelliottia]MDK9364602.1 hypothetical protein [Lelliottia sp. V106_12]MDK9616382.1 hypothetical protein [Lelliottia sp. V106_9]
MKYLLFILCLIFLPQYVLASNAEVQGVHRVFSVSEHNPYIIQRIMTITGRQEYVFVCMDYNKSEIYTGEYGAFSGFYQCKLLSMEDGVDVFQPVMDWGVTETRARFSLSQIIGGCKDHPLYGHRREFLVRGMKIRINIYDFSPMKSPESFWKVYNFKLQLDITNYPHATSAFSGYASEMCLSDSEKTDQFGNLIDDARIITENTY